MNYNTGSTLVNCPLNGNAEKLRSSTTETSDVRDIVDDFSLDITSFTATGGCSCKLPSAQLHAVCDSHQLRDARPVDHFDDDAAIVDLGSAFLVSSVDFQNPLLPDPRLSGQVAALNAMSDIFACGVQPGWAEVILGVPPVAADQQVDVGRKIIDGISEACNAVGCKVVGGHTVVLPTPIIGLAVRGVGSREHVKLKSGARPGDRILLTKPLGIGLIVSARQQGFITAQNWEEALRWILRPNAVGALLGPIGAVHALTDVTGFGLVGHATEVASASGTTLELDMARIPVLSSALRAAAAGLAPELSRSNRNDVAAQAHFDEWLTEAERVLLCDPQTNGGLLVTVAPEAAGAIQAVCTAHGELAVDVGVVSQRTGRALVHINKTGN